MFNQSKYSVIENVGLARLTLVLSELSLTENTTITVNTRDDLATSEYRLLWVIL